MNYRESEYFPGYQLGCPTCKDKLDQQMRAQDDANREPDPEDRVAVMRWLFHRYGASFRFDQGDLWQVSYMPRPRHYQEPLLVTMTARFDYVFRRAIIVTRDHTVTRITCEGIQMSEVIT